VAKNSNVAEFTAATQFTTFKICRFKNALKMKITVNATNRKV